MSASHHICSRRTQQFKYIAVDFVSAVLVWIFFLIFRWMVYDGRLFGMDTVLIPAFTFYYPLLIYPFGCLVLYYLSGYYLRPFGKRLPQEFFNTLFCAVVVSVIGFFCIIIDDHVANYTHYYGSLAVLFGFQFTLTYLLRLWVTLNTRRRFEKGNYSFNTLLIGRADRAAELQKELPTQHIVLTKEFSEITDFEALQKEYKIDSVIVATDKTGSEADLYNIINTLYPYRVQISFVPRVYDLLMGSVKIKALEDGPLITITDEPMSDSQMCIKRAFDAVVSAIALLLLSPLFAVLAVLIKRNSEGPVLYHQERIGLYGRPFQIYKFRTMYVNAEQKAPQLASADDPRITKVGHVLRKYRLDELPQLWNILKGDMSVVGPRPEREYYINQIRQLAPYYCLIYKLRPGLTSWGPIKVGYTDTLEKMVKRLNYDIAYMQDMSLVLDIKILFYTVKVIVDGKGQ